MANVDTSFANWSATSSSNQPDGTDTASIDEDMREIQGGVIRGLSHKGSDIASATAPALGGTDGLMHDITGTATITGFDTVRAGLLKVIKFEGALTLTHNATNLILLTGANRTTVAGDVGVYISEGSGNWRELCYMPINTQLTGQGVKFAATQAASSDANTLDDYEEGTWTPTITFATAGDLSVAYTTQVGTYAKVGRVVYVQGSIQTSTFTHTTASGALQINTLPFTPANTSGIFWECAAAIQGVTKANYTDFNVQINANLTTMAIVCSGSGQALGSVAAADMPTGGTVHIRFSGFYHV